MRLQLKIACMVFNGLLLWAGPVFAQKTIIAVATNFTGPAQEIAKLFNRSLGHKVVLSFGSTGKIYAQIIHGAPFSAFLAADRKRPQLLESSGLGVAGSRFTYARGRLVLLGGRQLLEKGLFKRLAIANPKTAPYGVGAIQVLERMGILQAVRGKLVFGENIGQTFQFVHTKNAELGLVAASYAKGEGWLVPQALHEPIEQQAVLLKKGRQDETAIKFLDFLKSKKATSILRGYGYSIVNE